MACAIVPPGLKVFEQNDLWSTRSKNSINDLLSLTQTSAPFVSFDRLIEGSKPSLATQLTALISYGFFNL
jgi:hypothetical protein